MFLRLQEHKTTHPITISTRRSATTPRNTPTNGPPNTLELLEVGVTEVVGTSMMITLKGSSGSCMVCMLRVAATASKVKESRVTCRMPDELFWQEREGVKKSKQLKV